MEQEHRSTGAVVLDMQLEPVDFHSISRRVLADPDESAGLRGEYPPSHSSNHHGDRSALVLVRIRGCVDLGLLARHRAAAIACVYEG
jgi:hypothetical protein